MTIRNRLVTPPAVEPVTLAEAKTYVRVDHASDDVVLQGMIEAAREVAEHFTRRAFITQVWETTHAYGVQAASSWAFGRRPVQSIQSVTAYAEDGTPTVMPVGEYALDGDTIVLGFAKAWPIGQRQVDALVVRWTAGYGAAPDDVPGAIRAAILQMVAAQYADRERGAIVDGGVARLLAPFKVYGRRS